MRTSAASVCNNHAPIRLARLASMRDACATAPPAITIDREPQVPVENGL
jgi:hypothetical protein